MRDVLPTLEISVRGLAEKKEMYPLSPRMMTLRRAFRRGAAMAGEGV